MKISKALLVLDSTISTDCAPIASFPPYIAIIRATMDMLTACPDIRMVANEEEATPYFSLPTEPMIALLLGEEKKANPSPMRAISAIITGKFVCRVTNANISNPSVVRAMPMDETILGSTLSERRPANGENSAMISGCDSITQPATPRGVPVVYELNFNDAASVFAATKMEVMPEDVIYVPLAGAAEARKFFEFVQSVTRVVYDVSVTSALNVN